MDNYNFVLQNLGLNSFNDIQKEFFNLNLKSSNTKLLAPTGSGKTLAFLLPVLHRISKDTKQTQAIIVVPTRELALQIEQVFSKMKTGLKLTCCYGGHKREIEENSLKDAPFIIVGTPGRICDHIRRGSIDCTFVNSIVLDEFDKILEMGFEEDTTFIIDSIHNLEKRILTSATNIENLPSVFDTQIFETLNKIQEAKPILIEHYYYYSKDEEKIDTLINLLQSVEDKKTIVFCNTRDAVEYIHNEMKMRGFPTVFYHGQMEQRDREVALFRYRSGVANVLVTTDIASRGLDIEFVRYVIHYNKPESEIIYTHRVGRTARMNEFGTSIMVLSPEEKLDDFSNFAIKEYEISKKLNEPSDTNWVLMKMPLGKKNKVNKVDIVGFLLKNGGLKSDDLGLIEVKDYMSYFAVRKSKASHLLHFLNSEKIKNKKPKISIIK